MYFLVKVSLASSSFLTKRPDTIFVEVYFRKFAEKMSHFMGHSWAFIVALTAILVWGVSGPFFSFSETWQLVVNTGTTIVTFLMVFLVQNAQNRSDAAMQLKLDELIEVQKKAHKDIIGAEEKSERAIQQKKKRVKRKKGG